MPSRDQSLDKVLAGHTFTVITRVVREYFVLLKLHNAENKFFKRYQCSLMRQGITLVHKKANVQHVVVLLYFEGTSICDEDRKWSVRRVFCGCTGRDRQGNEF